MKTGNVLRRVYGVTAALIGVLFFIIVGVFGLPWAIGGRSDC
jgi:biotin transporter BioY